MSRITKHIVLLFIIILIAALVLFTYLRLEPGAQPVKIGVVLPLTGDFETFGIVGLQGVQLAVDELNESRGLLNGRKVELIIEDNESDPNLAVKKMRKLIQEDDVLAIVGPVSSSARNAMAIVAEQFKTPILYGIDYEGMHYNRYLFCYSPIPDHVVSPIISYLTGNQYKTFYIFGYDYVWPHQMAHSFSEEVVRLGGKIVGKEFTPFGVRNFSAILERVANSGTEVVLLVMCGRDGQRFAQQFYSTGLKKKVRLVAIAAEESWSRNMASEEVEGILTVSHFLSSMSSPEAKSFTAKIKHKFGEDSIVTYSTEAHYGLIRLLAKAINTVESTENIEDIIDAMEGRLITVGNGEITMREDHHVNLNMVIAEFNNGQLIKRKNIGLIIPTDQRQKAK